MHSSCFDTSEGGGAEVGRTRGVSHSRRVRRMAAIRVACVKVWVVRGVHTESFFSHFSVSKPASLVGRLYLYRPTSIARYIEIDPRPEAATRHFEDAEDLQLARPFLSFSTTRFTRKWVLCSSRR